MTRRTIMILLFTFLLANIFNSIPVTSEGDGSGGITVFPSRVYIDMPEGYPAQEIQYFIRVYNRYFHPLNVSVKIYNPHSQDMVDGYSFIPDLSWVEIVPEKICIPANSSEKIFIHINIPDDEKPLHYNKGWEVWAITSEEKDPVYGGSAIATSLVTRLLISTPSGEAGLQIPLPILILICIVGAIAVHTAFFYLKNKKRSIYKNKAAIFHFKKKERTNKSKKN